MDSARAQQASAKVIPLSRERRSEMQQFVETHGAFVAKLMMHLMGPRGEAEDLTQEVFVVALRRMSQGEQVISPRAWLGAIAVRIAANARNRAWAKAVFVQPAPSDELADWKTPERMAESRQALEMLYRLLDTLSEKKRNVFVLHEIHGMPAPEVAEVLDLPIGTVYSRLRHARSEVAGLMAKRGLAG